MAGDIVGTIGDFVKLIIETVNKFTKNNPFYLLSFEYKH